MSEQGVHRPSGPFPSLPGGIDRKLKIYFDKYRAEGKLPPELVGHVQGKLFDDMKLLDVWRNNWKGLSWKDEEGNILAGAIDECLIDGDKLIVADFKTYGGSEIKEEKTEYYQNQLDCYSLLLEKNGYMHPEFAYLIFFMPEEVREHGIMKFKIEVKKVKVNPANALKRFNDAIKLLKGKKPARHSKCTFCSWADDYIKFE